MSASLTYHTLTNYSPERPWHEPLADPRLVTGFQICQQHCRPADFKTYPARLPAIHLPTSLPHHGVPAATILSASATAPSRPPTAPDDNPTAPSGTAIAPNGTPAALSGADQTPLTLPELARLLYYSAGVVRYRETQNGRSYYRACGSAGNRHPLELYVVTSGFDGLPAGVWHHDPLNHALQQIAAPPVAPGPSYVVITGIPWRSAWRYAERAWRHLWWDTGTMLAQFLALAESAGIPANLRLSFPDETVGAIVGADRAREFPLAVVVLGPGEPSLVPHSNGALGQYAADSVEFPLILATHRATEPAGPGWGPVSANHFAGMQPSAAGSMTLSNMDGYRPVSLEHVVLRRGSARRFRARTALPLDHLRWMIAAAARPAPWDAGQSLLHQHFAVHNVDGLAEGLYRWHDGDLVLTGAGNQREAAHRFCLGTDLARDAAVLAVHCADLPSANERLGERGYRAANLEAGLVSGRLHLAAHALGHAATGLVFNDELTPAFLHTDTTGLLATGLGTAAYRAVEGGKPLRPAQLRPR